MVRVSLDVEQPRDEIWAVLTDVKASAEFLSGVERVEILSDGPFQRGLRWKETRLMMGREETQELQVGEVSEPSRFEVLANSCGTSYLTVFELVEGDDATTIICSFDGKAETWMAWLFSWLGWLFEGQVKRMLLNDLRDVRSEALRRAAASKGLSNE